MDTQQGMNRHHALHAQIAEAREMVASLIKRYDISPSTPHDVRGINDFKKPFNKFFDHTVLKPETSAQQVHDLCREAIEHNVASVCISPNRVTQAVAMLKESEVAVCTVIGFPHGATMIGSKVHEVEELKALGCQEFDFVQPIGLVYDEDYYQLYCEMRAVVNAAFPCITKVILETALLTDEQKIIASVIAVSAGVNYLKTSTGFAFSGAMLEDIKLLRMIAGDDAGVKAAGGVRDYSFARQCISAGADRIGCSCTPKIIQDTN